MKNKKDILYNIEAKKTNSDFSNDVMNTIFSLDIAKELSLFKGINEHSVLETSKDFTTNILQKLEVQKSVFKPVVLFNFKQKMIMTLSVLLLFVLSYISKSNNTLNEFAKTNYSTDINLFKILDSISISPILSMSVACFTVLLLFDYTLQRKKI